MGRRTRSYLPGAAFHITSRTSGHSHWWEDEALRTEIVGYLADALRRTDAQLLAYVIMTNHFHLVVRQGDDPLARLMQPVCRRIALMVRRVHEREGHIFERVFRDKPCTDAAQLRQVIYYIHRNPEKAGMCVTAAEYAWSSCCSYNGFPAPATANALPRIVLGPALELFAPTAAASTQDMYAGYLQFARWRAVCDELPKEAPRPPGPAFPWGDHYWAGRFRSRPREKFARADLRDVVLQVLAERAPGLDIETLRLRRAGGVISEVRRTAIARAVAGGHRGVRIAQFLNVSESTVSKIASEVFLTKFRATQPDPQHR